MTEVDCPAARAQEPGPEAEDTGFVHEALYVDSVPAAVGVLTPLLSAGLDRDEPVVLACTESVTAQLLAAVGAGPRVVVLDRGTGRRRYVTALTACREMMEGKLVSGARRVHLVAEPGYWDPAADGPEPGRVEAAVNHALRNHPLSTVCLYDTSRLPARVLADGLLTHPLLRDDRGCTVNGRYLAPGEYLRGSLPGGPEPVEADLPVCEINGLFDLQALREALRATAGDTRALPPGSGGSEVLQDFMVAVNEVATNALRHGRPPVDVRVWSAPDRLVCTVSDRGRGVDDPFAGYLSPEGCGVAEGGMGLWLARQCCDRLDTMIHPWGFLVRLVSRR
jgi:hypothetical protein